MESSEKPATGKEDVSRPPPPRTGTILTVTFPGFAVDGTATRSLSASSTRLSRSGASPSASTKFPSPA